MRVGLVGCVKRKLEAPAPAADLYISPLFKGRRCFVEQSCDRWFVLSALHGLVTPEERIAPYDQTLKDASRAERADWSRRVLAQLEAELGSFSGHVFEVHAGSAYIDHGLAEGIEQRGGILALPVLGLRFGEQLAFYKKRCPYAY